MSPLVTASTAAPALPVDLEALMRSAENTLHTQTALITLISEGPEYV